MIELNGQNSEWGDDESGESGEESEEEDSEISSS